MVGVKTVHGRLADWLSKTWVQVLLAAVIFFLFSWLYMGRAITDCSTSTTALGSDSTGGFAWAQWASGNSFSWGHENRTNFPYGEDLSRPQYVTSAIFLSLYKLFSVISTPICGLNLMLLLGFMSTALVMFGLIKWLFRRFDLALFAGYAAAFVPYHILKAQSHFNYVYGSLFIALIWAFLWFMSRPSYRRAIILGLIGSLGYYFDGYFILISSVLIAGLFISPFIYDFRLALKGWKAVATQFRRRLPLLRYLVTSLLVVLLVTLPVLYTQKTHGKDISQSLALVRSDTKTETLIYGIRPIEFFLPSFNSPWVPSGYQAWRAAKLHGSNYSESTLFVGYTVIALSILALVSLVRRNWRSLKLQNLSYAYIIFAITVTFIICLSLSLPALAYLFGHHIRTPSLVLAKLSSNWRVLGRFFLALDPLLIMLASIGLYRLTKNRRRWIQTVIVIICGLLIFLEYLPRPISATGDLYKDAPPVYKQIAENPSISLVAEYPLSDFKYTPGILTFQPMFNKMLLNASDGAISLGPRDAALAGLDDIQTLGALKGIGVDAVITQGFASDNNGLTQLYSNVPKNADGSINYSASMYAYTINDAVHSRNSILVIEKGADFASVDEKTQLSHRIVTKSADFKILNIKNRDQSRYTVNLYANLAAGNNGTVTFKQGNHVLWTGKIGARPTAIDFATDGSSFNLQTSLPIDITNMSSQGQS